MKAKTPTEKEIRFQIKQYLKWKSWFVFYHLQDLVSYPGLPDLKAVKDGHTSILK